MKIKKGDIVARISYGKDILFVIDRVIKLKESESYVILKRAYNSNRGRCTSYRY